MKDLWNSFTRWWIHNQDAITWFIIGWMSMAGVIEIGNENYLYAALDFAVAYINYALRNVRLG